VAILTQLLISSQLHAHPLAEDRIFRRFLSVFLLLCMFGVVFLYFLYAREVDLSNPQFLVAFWVLQQMA